MDELFIASLVSLIVKRRSKIIVGTKQQARSSVTLSLFHLRVVKRPQPQFHIPLLISCIINLIFVFFLMLEL